MSKSKKLGKIEPSSWYEYIDWETQLLQEDLSAHLKPFPCLCCLLFPNKPKQCLTAWAPWSALLPSSSASLSTRPACYKGQSPHLPGGTIDSRSIERTRGGMEPRRDPGADQGVLKCTLPLLLPQASPSKDGISLGDGEWSSHFLYSHITKIISKF